MGIAQLIKRKQNKIDTILLDIIIREGASASVRVTENPVENGANVNDHVVVEPMTFYVEGVVSNISSSLFGQFTNLVTAFTKDLTKAQQAWDELDQLRISRKPFTLVQGLASYENVILLTCKQDTDKDTANGLFFTATFKELVYVGAQVVAPEQFSDSDTADKALPSTSGGLKQLEVA